MTLVKSLTRKLTLVGIVYVCLIGLTGGIAKILPSGFVPMEDKKAFMVDIQLPDGASLNRTEEVMRDLVELTLQEPGVENVIHASGFSILTGSVSSNGGLMIVTLSTWDERDTPDMVEAAIVAKLQAKYAANPSVKAMAFSLPPIPGVGSVGGFEFVLQDTQGRSPQELAAVMRALIMKANEQPEIAMAFSNFRADVPQMFVDVDRDKAKALGISLNEIFSTMQTMLGSMYVNDFNRFGKVFRVILKLKAIIEIQIGISPVFMYAPTPAKWCR